eukprot:CAMPEP_0117455478 /NCGR_PEP_ID=MMETSP0759-20121206/11382_1 /TAXON_ID=63605 /ORGANISM="Percolomonas cosmopolitus, Strain WS" /LENGTH=100 /DNA_ID=CAMNT_0005248787 /DNA_START=256 /DNA_END=558 /DNA_ORIENTATION=+
MSVSAIVVHELAKHGRNAVAVCEEKELLGRVRNGEVDMIVIGSGFDNEFQEMTRHRIISADSSLERTTKIMSKDSHPGQMVTHVNEMAVHWKCGKALGKL